MNDNIQALLRERAALRGLADMAVKARGELGTDDSATALFIERMAFNIAERWAQLDAQARLAIRASEHSAQQQIAGPPFRQFQPLPMPASILTHPSRHLLPRG